MQDIATTLAEVGYRASRDALLAVRALLRQGDGGARALLIEGAPGTGKTFLSECFARAMNAPYFYALLHSWSGADDLFCGVNVPAAVAGDADHVQQPGVLALVAEASHKHPLVVVCLDELDKAPESTEALLLDWLQSGRVPVRPGEHLQTRLDRVVVFLTSNAARAHTGALVRRCRRLRMKPLDETTLVDLVALRSNVPVGIARLVVRLCQAIAQAEGNDHGISIQEMVHAAREVWELAENHEDVILTLAGWAARSEDGEAVLRDPHHSVRKGIAALWGEIVAHRRKWLHEKGDSILRV